MGAFKVSVLSLCLILLGSFHDFLTFLAARSSSSSDVFFFDINFDLETMDVSLGSNNRLHLRIRVLGFNFLGNL